MTDSDLVSRVAAALYAARWAGASLRIAWADVDGKSRGDYVRMARAAVEVLRVEAEGVELVRREQEQVQEAPKGRLGGSSPFTTAASTVSARSDSRSESGRQSTSYAPTAPPAEPDPRTPDDWEGGDEPPEDARDADGLLPGEAAALAREEGRATLAPPDERDEDPELIPF